MVLLRVDKCSCKVPNEQWTENLAKQHSINLLLREINDGRIRCVMRRVLVISKANVPEGSGIQVVSGGHGGIAMHFMIRLQTAPRGQSAERSTNNNSACLARQSQHVA